MTKRKILFWIFVALALMATGLSVCFLFLGTKQIKGVPTALSVTNIEGENYVTAQYQNDYWYQFKLEQKLDGQFVLISQVNSQTNSVKLDFIDTLHGGEYRFSVRFITENGGGRGKFSDYYYWGSALNLNKVEKVTYDELSEKLSWQEVPNADFYNVKFVNSFGNIEFSLYVADNFVSLSDKVDVGSYDVYVVAMSTDTSIGNSYFGDSLKINISRKNQILSVVAQTELVITTSEKVEKFEIYSGDVLKSTLVTNEVERVGNKYVYNFLNVSGYLSGLDNLKIKSLACKFVGESDFKLFSVE